MARRVAFKGVGASAGIGIGRVHIVDRRRLRYPKQRVSSKQIGSEIERFYRAIQDSESQLQDLTERLGSSIDRFRLEPGPENRGKRHHRESREQGLDHEHLSILEAHRLMLRDPMLVQGTVVRISEERKCAEWALRMTLRDIRSLLDELADDYFRERRSDIDFVGDRILRNLTGDLPETEIELPENAVVVAHDLGPAETLGLVRHRLAGFVTDVGGKTSHTAILARALQVPAVVAAGNLSEFAVQNDIVVLNGGSGDVVLHPGRAVVAQYRDLARQRAVTDAELRGEAHLPSVSACGSAITLLANLEIGEAVDAVVGYGAEGVGLLRTEFMFLGGERPDYRRHRDAYCDVLRHLDGRPLTIRTLDLGGDKLPLGVNMAHESNPALGLRAIRYCLRERDLFVAQLRGILEASPHGPVRIMFPMISGVAELRAARALFEETKDDLRRRGIPFADPIPVGIMIELPAAVWVADLLAQETDFFSIGTNDLIQYLLAVDRDNEQVAYLYRPLHASVLRAMRHTARAASDAGIPLSICGEMASEPLYTPILMGLGFQALSMNARAIPRVKRMVRNVTLADARTLVEELLHLPTVGEMETLLSTRVQAMTPDGVL